MTRIHAWKLERKAKFGIGLSIDLTNPFTKGTQTYYYGKDEKELTKKYGTIDKRIYKWRKVV